MVDEIYSILLYFSILVIPTISSISIEKHKNQWIKYFLLTLAVFLALFSGIRYESVGWDTENYYRIIGYAIDSNFNRYPTEPGLFILAVLSSYIINSVNFVLFVVALLINGIIIYFIYDMRDRINISGSIFMYLLTSFILTLSGIRQWLAVSLILLSTKFLIENSKLTFYVLVFIAFLFHNSAIVALFFPFIKYIADNNIFNIERKYKKTIFTIMLLFIVLIALVVTMGMFPFTKKYISYLVNLKPTGGGKVFYAKLISYVMLFYLIFKKYVVLKSISTKYFLYFSFFGLILSIPGYYFLNIGRISWYFTIFEIMLIGALLKENNRMTYIFIFMIVSISVFLFLMDLIYNGRGVVPYKTILRLEWRLFV